MRKQRASSGTSTTPRSPAGAPPWWATATPPTTSPPRRSPGCCPAGSPCTTRRGTSTSPPPTWSGTAGAASSATGGCRPGWRSARPCSTPASDPWLRDMVERLPDRLRIPCPAPLLRRHERGGGRRRAEQARRNDQAHAVRRPCPVGQLAGGRPMTPRTPPPHRAAPAASGRFDAVFAGHGPALPPAAAAERGHRRLPGRHLRRPGDGRRRAASATRSSPPRWQRAVAHPRHDGRPSRWRRTVPATVARRATRAAPSRVTAPPEQVAPAYLRGEVLNACGLPGERPLRLHRGHHRGGLRAQRVTAPGPTAPAGTRSRAPAGRC